jgi:hypothetical protein
MGVELAFPTRTLYLEDPAANVTTRPTSSPTVIGLASRS